MLGVLVYVKLGHSRHICAFLSSVFFLLLLDEAWMLWPNFWWTVWVEISSWVLVSRCAKLKVEQNEWVNMSMYESRWNREASFLYFLSYVIYWGTMCFISYKKKEKKEKWTWIRRWGTNVGTSHIVLVISKRWLAEKFERKYLHSQVKNINW